MICRRWLISGRVQGVFFRASTQHTANTLGLCGWVRNRRDGTVEVLVQGEEKQVETMQKWLQTGPELAKVTNIVCIDEQLSSHHTEAFEIRATA